MTKKYQWYLFESLVFDFYQHEILPGICVLEARGKEQAMLVEEVQTDQAMWTIWYHQTNNV